MRLSWTALRPVRLRPSVAAPGEAAPCACRGHSSDRRPASSRRRTDRASWSGARGTHRARGIEDQLHRARRNLRGGERARRRQQHGEVAGFSRQTIRQQVQAELLASQAIENAQVVEGAVGAFDGDVRAVFARTAPRTCRLGSGSNRFRATGRCFAGGTPAATRAEPFRGRRRRLGSGVPTAGSGRSAS